MSCGALSHLLWKFWARVTGWNKGMTEELSSATLYFGYGSNLWKDQMSQRCPTSKYMGVARLHGYRWIINERGYANVVELGNGHDDDKDRESDEKKNKKSYTDEVWGLVYSLEKDDENRLDRNEGVPVAYTKEYLEVDFWQAHGGKTPDVNAKPKQVDSLVYINRKMTSPDTPKEEYIYRMNMGIKDALEEGVPKEYVKEVMRKFIPNKEDKAVEIMARKQAQSFEDEQ